MPTDMEKSTTAAEVGETSKANMKRDLLSHSDSWAVQYKLQTKSNDLVFSEKPMGRSEVAEWLKEKNEEDNSTTKIFAQHIPSVAEARTDPELGVPDGLWDIPGVRNLLTDSAAGSTFTRYPKNVMVAQTPLDDGPICSFAVQYTDGRDYHAMFYYSDPMFSPARILQDMMFMYRWRWSGLPVSIIPMGMLKAHNDYVAKKVLELDHDISELENVMSEARDPDDSLLDLGELTRQVHLLNRRLSKLERRARFQLDLFNLVTDTNAKLVGGGDRQRSDVEIQQTHLDALQKMMQARDYDFEAMPKRLETARMTIFNLIVQRDQRQGLALNRANMEIAESSRIMAEATMTDSASMKTIAILTMVFLPGTAVASFFSMTMFNWEAAGQQDGVTSSYIWVYFVASVPLTCMVLGLWWLTTRRRRQKILTRSREQTMQSMLPYSAQVTGSTMQGRLAKDMEDV